MASAPSKLAVDPAPLLPHLALAPEAVALVQGCADAETAVARLEGAGFLGEAAALVAHALPPRQAVWWACMCARHTAVSGSDPATEATVRDRAEAWVRGQTDALRRAAMEQAQAAGFASPEAWAAVGAFWSGDSMAPPDAPKVPPAPHLPGVATAGSVALSAVRGQATRREVRLRRFLASARDIAGGGPGRLEAEDG